ncbi:MAG TPA: hypothetical protein VIJ94_13135 [Caulobacteraceae bacterium]
MDGDDHVALHLLCQCAQQRGKLRDVDFIYALDRVVDHQPGQFRLQPDTASSGL